MYKLIVPDEAAMLALGEKLSANAQGGLIIFLYGQLGAGKTTFVRGFLRGLGYQGKVKSPTYTLVEPYEINHLKVFHFDLYRVKNPKELEFIGLQDYFEPGSVCLIEWPENGLHFLPPPDLSCFIEYCLEGREVKLAGLNF